MSIMDDNRRRVEGVFEAAEKLSGVDGFVMVGGYAVSARGRPRFSHDLDLVVAVKSWLKVNDVLRECGFDAKNRFPNPEKLEKVYAGETMRWSRDSTRSTMDVMIGGLVDPKVRIYVPYEKIAKGATPERIPNVLGIAASPRIPTAAVDVLVALKLQPGRPQDCSDLVNLVPVADAARCAETAVSFFGKPTAAKLVRWLLDDIDPAMDKWGHGVRYQVPPKDVRAGLEQAKRFFESIQKRISGQAA
jgi:hypothetical protein